MVASIFALWDLEVSHKAVSHWLDVLEHLYYVESLAMCDTISSRSRAAVSVQMTR